ncbi:ATP-grasp domain-containing protein, partial [Candidatus Dojkabacteria bacterium]|nr:ATP-grasp domain-containing protein [Candidatus Dojkabacteria bacterium]
MLNKFTSNRTSNIYLNAASELNLDFTILDEESGYSMIYSNDKQLYLIGDRLSLNDIVAKEFADNKELSIRLLAKAGLPTPTQITIDLNTDYSSTLYEFLKAYKNIVLKPVDGRAGANVFLRLDTQSKIDAAINNLKQSSVEKVLCEKFIEGANYRVLMFKGEII